MVGRRQRSREAVGLAQAFHPQSGLRQPDPVYVPRQNPPKRRTRFEQRELDTRRAAIDRQDAWVSWFQRQSVLRARSMALDLEFRR